MTVGLVIAACGARLPMTVRSAAANAALKTGQSHLVQPAGAPSAAPAATTGPLPPGQTPQPGQSGVAIPVPTGSSHDPGSRGGSAAPVTGPTSAQAAASCGKGTDVGLSSSTINLGTVASLTGPVAGLFQGAIQGIESYASYVNATAGGICGHQVHIATADDGTNCIQDQNATQNLVGKVFAFVGTFALYDGCGATIIKQHPTVPDIHVALDPAAYAPSNHFDLNSGEPGYATGMFRYYAQKYPAAVKHVGTIVENVPSAVAGQKNQVNAAQSQGWRFTDSILEAPTNSNFQGDFVKMCQQDHIQILFELTENAQNAATMMHNERQAGCPKSLINIVPIAYDQGFLPDYGGNPADLNGLQGYSGYALFYNKGEAANVPALQPFQTWFNRDYPNQPINLYAMYAWVDALMFTQAVEHAGPTVNRRTVLGSLRRLKNFNGGGIIAPRDPGSRTGFHCYILWQLENGQFNRIDDPKAGFRCDGQFLPRSGG